MEFNVKKPDSNTEVEPVIAEFDHKDYFGLNTPEAYETLFYEIIKGDQSLFTRFDGVEEAWRIVDNIIHCKDECPLVEKYTAGSIGPKNAERLLKEDGRKWHNL